MGNNTKAERDRRQRQHDIDVSVCYGYTPWKLYYEDEEVFMYIVDAELDPIRIAYNYSGFIQIGDEEYSYAILSAKTLREIANMEDAAQAIYQDMDLEDE
jgi:hypothetical protein